FDLNDDVLMKDILSGSYTGDPESRNIQMLYLISAFISIPYRIIRTLDWYGIFLCFCQIGCIFLLVYRSMSFAKSFYGKAILLITEITVILGLMLNHLLIVQYTFTVALMSATAAFLFLTTGNDFKRRFISDIGALIIIWIAYLIRSEMLLLTIPMTGLAFCFRQAADIRDAAKPAGMLGHTYNKRNDEEARTVHEIIGYFLVMCIILFAGIGVCQLSHRIAYSSEEWKEFTAFFDNRTELYDFQSIPDYEENKEFYDSIGITQAEQELFINYNFGLDEEIDSELVGEIADYAATIKSDEEPLFTRIKNVIPQYIYRLHSIAMPKSYEYPMTDFPYNIVMIFMYIAVFAVYMISEIHKEGAGKRFIYIFPQLFLLFVCRTTLWGYILVRGRDPIRITHSLYVLEIIILCGLFIIRIQGLLNTERDSLRSINVDTYRQNAPDFNRKPIACAAGLAFVLTITGIVGTVFNVKIVRAEDAERIATNQSYKEIYSYCRLNKDNFYFFDVYTTTHYSEKMFENVNNSISNYDIMGGWASKSPLYQKKLEAFGYTDMQSALLEDNAFFVTSPSLSVEEDTTWLSNYYADQGIEVEIELVDEIEGFEVYSVREK
nr:hypothetical protein [Butyrivibrio sp.]